MLLTVSEVAKKFRVHRITVIRWCNRGVFSYVVLPSRGKLKQYRIYEHEVEMYLRGKGH